MALTSILYLSTLSTQIYALLVHFPRPKSFARPKQFALLFILSGFSTLLSLPLLFGSINRNAVPRYIGQAIMGVSVANFIWTAKTTHRGRLNAIFGGQTPDFVIAEGPFKYVRHPAYTAYMLGWTGTWLSLVGQVPLWNVLSLAASVAGLGGVYRAAATGEEKAFLQSENPDARKQYVGYCQRVKYRWVPGLA